MERAPSSEEIRATPLGRYVSGNGWLLWCTDPELCGSILWGRLDEAAIGEIATPFASLYSPQMTLMASEVTAPHLEESRSGGIVPSACPRPAAMRVGTDRPVRASSPLLSCTSPRGLAARVRVRVPWPSGPRPPCAPERNPTRGIPGATVAPVAAQVSSTADTPARTPNRLLQAARTHACSLRFRIGAR